MRTLTGVKRLVVKIGTATLSKDRVLDMDYLSTIAEQTQTLRERGVAVLVVTSGAIGLGANEMGIKERPSGIPLRQALASIGQPLLMQAWRQAFSERRIAVAQVLLTYDVLSGRSSYLNLRTTVDTLLGLGVIPIFNENDPVSIAEITRAFGDNDRLSALIASKVDADLLILLSDVDSLYKEDPRLNPLAERIPFVENISKEMIEGAGGTGTGFSTGGMKTKLRAALIAQRAGCATVLAHGRTENCLLRIVDGEDIGTLFSAKERLPNRLRWLHQALPTGWISVDEGAMEALKNHKSLLPKGVNSVEGNFTRGSVILVNSEIKLVTKYSSDEMRLARGKDLEEVKILLGWKDVIARPEDMAFMDPRENSPTP